jgi:hypothetical protein
MENNMPVHFPAVKAVLDGIIANWTAGNGGPPDLAGKHGATFKWDTSPDLLAASGAGIRLIQPEIVGQAGQGASANLVQDLIAGIPPFPQMPFGGLDSNTATFLTLASPEIQTIIAWIEDGCLP